MMTGKTALFVTTSNECSRAKRAKWKNIVLWDYNAHLPMNSHNVAKNISFEWIVTIANGKESEIE